jgi:four helix bundle protein
MSLIEDFEEMDAWKLARIFNKTIYQLTYNHEFSNDFALKNQIRKSAISIMANIAEGFERNSKLQIIYFMNVACGSAGESRSHLYIAKDLNYISDKEFDHAMNLIKRISKLLNAFIYSKKDHGSPIHRSPLDK